MKEGQMYVLYHFCPDKRYKIGFRFDKLYEHESRRKLMRIADAEAKKGLPKKGKYIIEKVY